MEYVGLIQPSDQRRVVCEIRTGVPERKRTSRGRKIETSFASGLERILGRSELVEMIVERKDTSRRFFAIYMRRDA